MIGRASIPAVAAQPTDFARTMRVLAVVDQGAIIGYGDYLVANAGPLDVIAVDETGTVTTLLEDFATEQIMTARTLDGGVWLPSIDPHSTAPGAFATNHGGTWHTVTVEVDGLAVVEHLYDSIRDPDTGDLLGCGAHSPDTAFVWRSTDNGATWAEDLAYASGEPDGDNRFYGFRTSGGLVVVSKSDNSGHFVLTEGEWVETETVELDAIPSPINLATMPGGSGGWSAVEADDGSIWLCDGESIYLIPPPA